jgi:hypothetical protein
MERVAFLIEDTGERLGCLLNPESLVVRRYAGILPRRSVGGKLTGSALSDDPLLYTGGGSTELGLDLLFDVSIAGSTIQAVDVRELTRPLWELAENATGDDGFGRPPLVRFVWGKTWNIPGVVTAVAERLEQFSTGGTPRRSWLRMRLVRVSEDESELEEWPVGGTELVPPPEGLEIPDEQVQVHQVMGGGAHEGEESGERLEDIAFQYYGDPSAWRVIAAFNGLSDPSRVPPGTLLRIPALSTLGAAS